MTQKTNPELRVSQPRTDRCFDTSHSMPVVSIPVEVDIRNCDGIDLLRSLQDNSVDLILADPPYGISKDSGMNKLHERKKAGEELTPTEKKFETATKYGKWDEYFPLYLLRT